MASLKAQTQGTTAGESYTLKFDVKCSKFLVKNLSGGTIHVCFGEYNEDDSVTIPEDSAQVLIRNELPSLKNDNYTDTICVKADAASDIGVEVQCLKFIEV